MKKLFISLSLFVALQACAQTPGINPETIPVAAVFNNQQEKTQQVEIVFCLDATGSMSGLIGTAKEKIWSIVTEISNDSIPTEVKLGMVFYRDRGDAFETKEIQLTADIDSVYDALLSMQALGGGDTPEGLNKGLYEVSFGF